MATDAYSGANLISRQCREVATNHGLTGETPGYKLGRWQSGKKAGDPRIAPNADQLFSWGPNREPRARIF